MKKNIILFFIFLYGINIYSQEGAIKLFNRSFYGIYGGYGLSQNFANINLREYIPIDNCCEHFGNTWGSGFSLGLLYQLPIMNFTDSKLFDNSSVTFQLGFSKSATNFLQTDKKLINYNGTVTDGTFQYQFNTDLSLLNLDILYSHELYKSIFVSGGFGFGYIISGKYNSLEKITDPPDLTFKENNKNTSKENNKNTSKENNKNTRNEMSGDLDLSKFKFGLKLGINYQLPLNSSRTFFVVPEVNYFYRFGNVVNGLDWSFNSLNLGISVKYSPESLCKEGLEYFNGKCLPICTGGKIRDDNGDCKCPPGYEEIKGNCENIQQRIIAENRRKDSIETARRLEEQREKNRKDSILLAAKLIEEKRIRDSIQTAYAKVIEEKRIKDSTDAAQARKMEEKRVRDSVELAKAKLIEDRRTRDSLEIVKAKQLEERRTRDSLQAALNKLNEERRIRDSLDLAKAKLQEEKRVRDSIDLAKAMLNKEMSVKDSINLAQARLREEKRVRDSVELAQARQREIKRLSDSVELAKAKQQDEKQNKDSIAQADKNRQALLASEAEKQRIKDSLDLAKAKWLINETRRRDSLAIVIQEPKINTIDSAEIAKRRQFVSDSILAATKISDEKNKGQRDSIDAAVKLDKEREKFLKDSLAIAFRLELELKASQAKSMEIKRQQDSINALDKVFDAEFIDPAKIDNTNPLVSGLCMDKDGNYIVTGSFSFQFDYGNQTKKANGITDIFVMKLNSDRQLIWIKNFGGTDGDATCSGVTTDKSGRIYIAGQFHGSLNFGNKNKLNCKDHDVFIACLDNGGKVIWSDQLKGDGSEDCYGISIDSKDNIYIAGIFDSPNLKFRNNPLSIKNKIGKGNPNIFIAKYSSNQKAEWIYNPGGTGLQDIKTITVDSKDDIIISGYFNQKLTFTGANREESIEYNKKDSYDNFIAKYGSDQTLKFLKQVSLNGGDITGLATDMNNNICVTGSFIGTPNLDNKSDIKLKSKSNKKDILLSKYDEKGNLVWAKQAGGVGDDEARSISVDEKGNMYITGSFVEKAIFDSDEKLSDMRTIESNSKSKHVFVAKYDWNGKCIWAKPALGDGTDYGLRIVTDKTGSFISGFFSKPGTDFGDNFLPTSEEKEKGAAFLIKIKEKVKNKGTIKGK